MDYDQRIKAALQIGVREGLGGCALEGHVARSIGLDQIQDAATLDRIVDSFKRIVYRVSRKPAAATQGQPTLFN